MFCPQLSSDHMGSHCARSLGCPVLTQLDFLLPWGLQGLGRQVKGTSQERPGAAGLAATGCSLCVLVRQLEASSAL